MFQIQDMFENGKPDIVLKTVIDLKKVKNCKLSCLIKCWLQFYNRLTLDTGRDPKSPFLTLSVRNGPRLVLELMSPAVRYTKKFSKYSYIIIYYHFDKVYISLKKFSPLRLQKIIFPPVVIYVCPKGKFFFESFIRRVGENR